MRVLYYTALSILVLGGLNWGYVGVAGVDLIGLLFGRFDALARTLYTMTAFSGIFVGFANLLAPHWVVGSTPQEAKPVRREIVAI